MIEKKSNVIFSDSICQEGEKKKRSCMSVHASYISFYYELRRRTMTTTIKRKTKEKEEKKKKCLFASFFSDFVSV